MIASCTRLLAQAQANITFFQTILFHSCQTIVKPLPPRAQPRPRDQTRRPVGPARGTDHHLDAQQPDRSPPGCTGPPTRLGGRRASSRENADDAHAAARRTRQRAGFKAAPVHSTPDGSRSCAFDPQRARAPVLPADPMLPAVPLRQSTGRSGERGRQPSPQETPASTARGLDAPLGDGPARDRPVGC